MLTSYQTCSNTLAIFFIGCNSLSASTPRSSDHLRAVVTRSRPLFTLLPVFVALLAVLLRLSANLDSIGSFIASYDLLAIKTYARFDRYSAIRAWLVCVWACMTSRCYNKSDCAFYSYSLLGCFRKCDQFCALLQSATCLRRTLPCNWCMLHCRKSALGILPPSIKAAHLRRVNKSTTTTCSLCPIWFLLFPCYFLLLRGVYVTIAPRLMSVCAVGPVLVPPSPTFQHKDTVPSAD